MIFRTHNSEIWELSCNSMELFVGSWPPMIFYWLFCVQINNSFHLWCMLRGSVWIWMKSNLFRLIEGQLHFRTFLACQDDFDPLWRIQHRIFLFQTSTLPPSMHRKNLLNMEDIVCKTTNSRWVHEYVLLYMFCTIWPSTIGSSADKPRDGWFYLFRYGQCYYTSLALATGLLCREVRESKKNNWSKKTYLKRMILVALVAHLVDEYYMLLVRLLAQVVREAPFSRRVRQIILRRLLSNPEPTWLTSEFIIL